MTLEDAIREVREIQEQDERMARLETARSDPRMQLVAEGLAALSRYGPDEAFLIVEAIVACRPISEVARLLVCSPKIIR